jgi:hypothetical protein
MVENWSMNDAVYDKTDVAHIVYLRECVWCSVTVGVRPPMHTPFPNTPLLGVD